MKALEKQAVRALSCNLAETTIMSLPVELGTFSHQPYHLLVDSLLVCCMHLLLLRHSPRMLTMLLSWLALDSDHMLSNQWNDEGRDVVLRFCCRCLCHVWCTILDISHGWTYLCSVYAYFTYRVPACKALVPAAADDRKERSPRDCCKTESAATGG